MDRCRLCDEIIERDEERYEGLELEDDRIYHVECAPADDVESGVLVLVVR